MRFATGGQPVSSDIEQLISSIPNLLVNIPGVGNVDISKVGYVFGKKEIGWRGIRPVSRI